ncbi:MAG: hypothetical protein OEV30_11805 [Ignavibacteria bacterium]|nr:hypothetical protein [Ignavibacteria bacterium]
MGRQSAAKEHFFTHGDRKPDWKGIPPAILGRLSALRVVSTRPGLSRVSFFHDR